MPTATSISHKKELKHDPVTTAACESETMGKSSKSRKRNPDGRQRARAPPTPAVAFQELRGAIGSAEAAREELEQAEEDIERSLVPLAVCMCWLLPRCVLSASLCACVGCCPLHALCDILVWACMHEV